MEWISTNDFLPGKSVTRCIYYFSDGSCGIYNPQRFDIKKEFRTDKKSDAFQYVIYWAKITNSEKNEE